MNKVARYRGNKNGNEITKQPGYMYITNDGLTIIDDLHKEIKFYNKDKLENILPSITLGACTSLGIIKGQDNNSFSWTDPNNVILNDSILAEWNKTVLVRKEGSYPQNYQDGIIVAITSKELINKNIYKTNNFIDNTIQNNKTYYYQLFSQIVAGTWNNLIANRFAIATDLNWYQIRDFVRAGRGAELFPIGTVFEVNHDEYKHQDGTGLLFRVVGHDLMQAQDETLTHSMMLDMVDCLSNTFAYDATENLYALTADTIAITGKFYYILNETTYTALVEGTDWNPGDHIPIASWYEKIVNNML